MNGQYYHPDGDPIQFDSMPPKRQRTPGDGYAIASLSMGIGAYATIFCCCMDLSYALVVGFLLAALSIVTAVLAKRNDRWHRMPKMATAGLVLSIVYLIILALLVGLLITFFLRGELWLDVWNSYYQDSFGGMSPYEYFSQME